MEKALALDFCFSLEIVDKPIFEDSKYHIVKKSIPEAYLTIVNEYYKSIMTYKEQIVFFANDDYNILQLLLLDINKFDSLTVLKEQLRALKHESLNSLLNQYVLDKPKGQSIDYDSISQTDFSEANKWRFLSVISHFDEKKEAILSVFDELVSFYNQSLEMIMTDFQEKIQFIEKTWSQESDKLYEILYKDYLSLSNYTLATQKLVFLLSFKRILYIQKEDQHWIGVGLYAYDFYQELKGHELITSDERETVLKILSDSTRFGILKLINQGIWSNKILAAKFEISSPAVSYQLKHLAEHRVILFDKSTRKYTVNKGLLKTVFEAISKELNIEAD